MAGQTDLQHILKTMQPILNDGEYVFCTVSVPDDVDQQKIIFMFREREGVTLVLKKETADQLKLNYSFVSAWITLTVHSALDAVGLTAAFATALGKENISCNVVAAYYHDHIFVASKDATKAMDTLVLLSKSSQ